MIMADATPRSSLTIAIERTPFGMIEAQMPPASVNHVALHLTGQSLLEWTPDARPFVGRPMRGAVTIVPHGRSGRLRVSGSASEVLKIGIPNSTFEAWAEADERVWDRSPLRDRFAAYEPLVAEIGMTLLRETERPGVVDFLYRDALSNALVAHLIRRHSEQASIEPTEARVVHALSPSRARRCKEFLEADLGRAIGLADIGRELGMSVSHFSAQFKKSFGGSPSRYLTWVRLERARLLLETTRKPVSDISCEVGFASASHFSKAFRDLYGETPSTWRQHRA